MLRARAAGCAGSLCGGGGGPCLGSINGAAGGADLEDGRARVGAGVGAVVDRAPVASGLRLVAPSNGCLGTCIKVQCDDSRT